MFGDLNIWEAPSQSVGTRCTSAMHCKVFLLFFLVDACISQEKFTAAVLEHVPYFEISNEVLDRSTALQIMMKNLAVYAQRAEDAKNGGADIIVFPEDGLYGFEFTRDTVLPYLEDIPDPKALDEPWNPCKVPQRFGSQTEVLHTLSCIALDNSIAIVANMGDVKYCSDSDPDCPEDGRYQFNTDVVFDTDGTLLARYHKEHLFHEHQFNAPLECEHVTFETSFKVRFGVFTCFDILFSDPAITLVKDHGVQNVVFPTTWVNCLPILSAVQFQQAWSRATCTNLLAANQHFPKYNITGSGIYSCGDAHAYIYNNSKASGGQLAIAELPISTKSADCKTPLSPPVEMTLELLQAKIAGKILFNATMFKDVYTFTSLEGTEGSVTTCKAGLCCEANYTISTTGKSSPPERYVLGAFSGHHHWAGGYFLQVCALVKCGSDTDESCGVPTETASTVFESISMFGSFSRNTTVFPELLGNGIKLAPSSVIEFDGNKMTVNAFKEPLVAAVLFGRLYSED